MVEIEINKLYDLILIKMISITIDEIYTKSMVLMHLIHINANKKKVNNYTMIKSGE